MEPIVLEKSYTGRQPDATLRTIAYRLKGRYDQLTVAPVGNGSLLCLGNPRGAALFAAGETEEDWRGPLLLLWLAEQLSLAVEQGGTIGEMEPAHMLEQRGLLLLPVLPSRQEQEELWQMTAPSRLYLLRDEQSGVGSRTEGHTWPETLLIGRLLSSCRAGNGGHPLAWEAPADSPESRFSRLRAQPALSLGLEARGTEVCLPDLWKQAQEQLLLAAVL